jgi:serine/threonine protein kinase
MASLSSASTISHYKIIGPIGSGGMGEVYKALDLQLGRIVALKTLLPLKAGEPGAHLRFLREARAASILAHPSICTIYEIREEGDLTFIAMEYVEGRTIQDILDDGPLSPESALGYALDVADALQEAHRNGVIHRDIKPSNIIVNARDVAVVLDFGLAKQISFAKGLNEELPTLMELTSTTTLVGTAPYMPPEQIRGEPLDARSDIFSFGVTFYEMLTGVRPFNSLNTVDVLYSILHNEPEPINKIRPELGEELAAIVSKTLEKDKSHRYESADHLRLELTAYIQNSGYLVRGVSSSPVSSRSVAQVRTAVLASRARSKSARPTGTRALLPYALILFIAIALAAGVWWFLVRNNSTASNPLLSLRHVQVIDWKNETGEFGTDAVFSHDGRMIAFSSIRGKYRDIWLKQTTMGDANQITRGEWNSWNPIWSPDNQQIAFLSRRGDKTAIWRMPVLGGTPTLIASLSNGGERLRYWSKDGATIYYELVRNLYAVDIATQKTKQVTNFEEDEHSENLNFSVSPQEDHIAYVDRRNGQVDVWAQPIGGGPAVQVTHDEAEDLNPVWHPDGKRIIYSCMRNGVDQICVAYLDGREPVQITSGETNKLVSDVSGVGAAILYAVSKEESDIWGVKVGNGAEREITSEAATELWPSISPDGKTIAYQSISDPEQGSKLHESLILVRPVENEGQKIQLAAGGINPTWSPDGGRLAFVRRSGVTSDIWTVRATSGDEKQLTNRGVAVGYSPLPYNRLESLSYSWSPDASKIAYLAGAGQYSLAVVAADGSGDTTISNTSGMTRYCPIWSPDSSGLAYVVFAKDGSGERAWSIWLADLKTNKSVAIFQAPSAILLLGWLGSGSELLAATIESQRIFSATQPAEVHLILIPRSGGAGQALTILKSAYFNNIHLSPDKGTIAFVARNDGKDNIWTMPARGGEAKKLTSNTDSRLYFSSMGFSTDGQTIYFGKQSSSTVISMIDNFK